ncbi:hypothetical protein BGZ49_000639 [Haplosporangium sp. Z 27]|nr:hypothetical protein BGZ49_000639 [Haplosporangium sp. Z 27]
MGSSAAGVMKKLLWRRRGIVNTNDGSAGGGFLGPTTAQSFVIVGGQDAGTTVYDLESLSPPFPHSPTMSSPQSPVSPTSPKSPTFSQSMLTRITGREYRSSPILEISAPIMTPMRGRPRSPSAADVSINSSVPALPTASTSKKYSRRSLSVDNLRVANENFVPCKDLDSSIKTTRHQMGQQADVEAHIQHGQQDQSQKVNEPDLEFYRKSVDFLNVHHSRSSTSDDWATRNKRKACVSKRRRSESSLLNRVTEASLGDTGDNSSPVPPENNDDPDPFGPGSCWKDINPSSSADYDLNEEYRSLLSNVDIMLVPCVSSPTRYYNCPKSRKVVQTYIASGEREFDEMIMSGFPASAIMEDKDGKVKDCRFMTLRLTLTPWHARADESQLYGSGDPEKSVPLKDMVNKFLSKTSLMMSCSPPRALCQVPEGKSTSLKGRRVPATDSFPAQPVAQIVMSSSQRLHPLDNSSVISLTPHYEPEVMSVKHTDNQTTNVCLPRNLAKGKTDAFRREKGFQILDPSTPPLTPHVTRNAKSTEVLNKSAGLYISPPTTPSPTSLSPNQYQPHPYGHSQQQPPRKGSLSAMSMPINTYYSGNTTATEDNVLVPPTVPPRHKLSSPAIFNEFKESLPTPDLFSRPRPTTPLTNTSKSYATQPQFSQPLSLPPRRAITSPLPLSKSTPSPISANTNSTLPIPIPTPNICQQRHQKNQQQMVLSSTDDDSFGISFARTPQAPPRKRSDQFDNVPGKTMTMPTPKPGYDVNTMTKTPTTQDYGSISHRHYHERSEYVPRTQYTPPVITH